MNDHTTRYSDRKDSGIPSPEDGAIVVTIMVFAAVFLVIGLSLYWLIAAQTRSTELERTDVKAFNVAEAGVDAGMYTLALDWPTIEPPDPDHEISVNEAALKQALQTENETLWDPSRSDATEFIKVSLYDNVDTSSGEPYETTAVADPDAPAWDYNRDRKMFVDSESNVDDDRHRILVLAERQVWPLNFPINVALFATELTARSGMTARVEDGTPPIYSVVTTDPEKKGLLQMGGMASYPNEQDKTLSDFVTQDMLNALRAIAVTQERYCYGGAEAESQANDCLEDLENNPVAGGVVYLESTEVGKKIRLGNQVALLGSPSKPVVIIVDAPDATEIEWAGNTILYGIVVTVGNATLSGTPHIHGALYSSGLLTNNGSADTEVVFNQTVIQNINGGYTVSVNIVPNTWEEYTLPKTASAAATP